MPDPSTEVKVKRVVAALLLRADEILCCQRAKDDPFPLKWEFPGGKIEPNESPEAALRRELVEELAIEAEIGPLIETIRHTYTPGVVIELHFFRVDRWTSEIKNLIFNDVRWVHRNEMPSLDFLEADLELVREIAAGRKL
ncbi:MAG TPA: (deoxy)nucleoside triphosphate pyrophosphohydrolase [Candidatus Koribacter sp.]|jgi:8-oxo-dGTP diphosphatase